MSSYRSFASFLALLAPVVVLQGIGVSQVVDGDGQEDVQEDVVTTDEENDEVHAGEDADGVDTTEGLDAVVHHDVPILTGQDLDDFAEKLDD